jgi:hypothetical protein
MRRFFIWRQKQPIFLPAFYYISSLNCLYMRVIYFVSFLLLSIQISAQAQHDSVPASIAGGQDAWRKFLEKNIHPEVPVDNGAKVGNYIVTVSFMVDTTGTVSDVQVENDPGYGMATDVLKAFKHCPKWIPATIDGNKVPYGQKQNIYYQVSKM